MIGQPNQTYRLRWNNDSSAELNLSDSVRELRENSEFFDVSLGCAARGGGSRTLRAHKMILGAYSTVFREMFQQHPNKNDPIIYLKGVSFLELGSILDFMYNGEVNITQANLSSFLAVAEELQIKGLQLNQKENAQIKRPRSQEELESFGKKQRYETIEKYMKQEKFDATKYFKQDKLNTIRNMKKEKMEDASSRTSTMPPTTSNDNAADDSDGEPIAEGQVGDVEQFIKNIEEHFISGGQKRTLAICRICRKKQRRDRIKKHIRGVHKAYVNGQAMKEEAAIPSSLDSVYEQLGVTEDSEIQDSENQEQGEEEEEEEEDVSTEFIEA